MLQDDLERGRHGCHVWGSHTPYAENSTQRGDYVRYLRGDSQVPTCTIMIDQNRSICIKSKGYTELEELELGILGVSVWRKSILSTFEPL